MLTVTFSSLVLAFSSKNQSLVYFGVSLASISNSFGENVLLGLGSFYSPKLSLAGYGSGMGISEFLVTISYAVLKYFTNIPVDKSMLLMLILPIIMCFSYFLLPPYEYDFTKVYKNDETVMVLKRLNAKKLAETLKVEDFTYKEKLKFLKHLLKYTVPTFFIFLIVYLTINGLFELLYFPKDKFISSHSTQFSLYNVFYRLGCFLGGGSIRFVQINTVSVFPLLLFVSFLVLLAQVVFDFIHLIWIVFIITLMQGVLCGAGYIK
jgi:hypothetical protein